VKEAQLGVVTCRTYGAQYSYSHRPQPFRAGLHSVAPPALRLCRGRFGISRW